MERRVRPIPWVKAEEFEFVDGEVLLAIRLVMFAMPTLVVVVGNDKVRGCYGSENVYDRSHFDYYAVITYPKVKR